MVQPHALGRLPIRPCLSLGIRARLLQALNSQKCIGSRNLWTLGIETSCDDTCVSVLRTYGGKAVLTHQARVPCSNKKYEGIHPLEAVESHTRNLPKLVQEALQHIGTGYGQRFVPSTPPQPWDSRLDVPPRLYRPDLIAVTRGPGMKTCLSIGISMAKALSVALSVPLIGVHHMQAHALTPQMEAAIRLTSHKDADPGPQYPFLTLLVSGGHTMLVHTTSNIDHRIMASTSRGRVDPKEKASPIAIGDMLDKCARVILPDNLIPQDEESVIYAKLMEDFVRDSKYNGMMHFAYGAPEKRQNEIEIYQSKSGWALPPPLRLSREMKYDFSGLGGMARSIMQKTPDMPRDGRLELAYHTMRLAFEHLASRVVLALQEDEKLLANPPKHLVISGGVASNKFLRRVLEAVLKARGFGDIQVIAPNPLWCTDNAAMIAWTGAEMYQSGWMTDNTFLPKSEWPIEQIITGTDCWIRRDVVPPLETGKDADQQKGKPSDRSPPVDTPASVPTDHQPEASLTVLAAEKSGEGQSSTRKARPADMKKAGRQKRHRSATQKQAEAKLSTEEQLQRIQERIKRLVHADRHQEIKGKNDTPPLEIDQHGTSSALSQPRREIVKMPNKQAESAQAEPVAAEGPQGGVLVRQVPFGHRGALADRVPETFPGSRQQPVGVNGVRRKTDRSPGKASKQTTASRSKAEHGRPKRRAPRADHALKAFQGPRQQTVPVSGDERKADRSHYKTSEQMVKPRSGTDRSGEDSGQKKHIVRLLRPQEPLLEVKPPNTPDTAAKGTLQKGLGMLKRWAGF